MKKAMYLIVKTPAPDGRHYQLTPAYDLLPVILVLPEDKEETALSLGGKHSRLNRSDFLQLAQHLNLPPKVGERVMNRLQTLENVFIGIVNESHLSEEEKQAFEALIKSRMRRLQAEKHLLSLSIPTWGRLGTEV